MFRKILKVILKIKLSLYIYRIFFLEGVFEIYFDKIENFVIIFEIYIINFKGIMNC